jgi:hypothetical protein
MRRTLILAALSLVLPAASAQVRFHGIPPSVTSMSGGRFHGIPPSLTSPTPVGFRGQFFGGGGFVHGGGRFGHFRGVNVFFGSPFPHRRFFFGNPGFFPGFGAFPVFVGPAYPYDPYYAYPPPAYPAAYQGAPDYDRGDDALAREVDRLREEVDRLRDDRYDRSRSEPPPSRAPEKPAAEVASTILVFRDGHRLEARNYAIVGQTLWIFSEDRARKMPLSDLDVTATRALNEDRGVEFNAPSRR